MSNAILIPNTRFQIGLSNDEKEPIGLAIVQEGTGVLYVAKMTIEGARQTGLQLLKIAEEVKIHGYQLGAKI